MGTRSYCCLQLSCLEIIFSLGNYKKIQKLYKILKLILWSFELKHLTSPNNKNIIKIITLLFLKRVSLVLASIFVGQLFIRNSTGKIESSCFEPSLQFMITFSPTIRAFFIVRSLGIVSFSMVICPESGCLLCGEWQLNLSQRALNLHVCVWVCV